MSNEVRNETSSTTGGCALRRGGGDGGCRADAHLPGAAAADGLPDGGEDVLRQDASHSKLLRICVELSNSNLIEIWKSNQDSWRNVAEFSIRRGSLQIPKVQRKAKLIDLVISSPTSIWLRNLASIQKGTRRPQADI